MRRHVEGEKEVSWLSTQGEQEWTLFHPTKSPRESTGKSSYASLPKIHPLSVKLVYFHFSDPPFLPSTSLTLFKQNTHTYTQADIHSSVRNCDLQQKNPPLPSTSKLISWDRKCRIPDKCQTLVLAANHHSAFKDRRLLRRTLFPTTCNKTF